MKITIQLFSFYRELTGKAQLEMEVAPDTTLEGLKNQIFAELPQIQSMSKATLLAVGVEYQPGSYLLQPGDVVSLFPPVQGG